MDQGGSSSQHGDPNFALYDAYGPGMDVDADGAFQMGVWDHQGQAGQGGYPDVSGGDDGFDPTSGMDDFGTAHYGQEYQHTQSFEQDGQQFQQFLNSEQIGDQQTAHDGYDMDSMDLYHPHTIYPNLGQDTVEYGITLMFLLTA